MPVTGFDWMWVWWGGTVVLCLWKLIEAVFFRPVRMLEWPFLASAMWAYFFGFMAYKAKLTLPEYLPNGMSAIGQLIDFLCLFGLLAGWSLGKRIPLKTTPKVQNYPYLLCWMIGFFFLMLGALGNYSVSQAQDEGELNYHTASAYWYLLFYVGYPGLAITLWASLKSRSPASYFLLGLTLIGLGVFMFPQLATARRGPLFAAIIPLLLVPPMTLRRPPNRLLYCGGLLAAGVLMLLFVQVRATIYHGGTWTEAFQKLDIGDAVADRGDDAEDNEYINNCQLIGTVYQTGHYEYGTGDFGLLFHWVPRAFWPNKPALGEGYFPTYLLYDDMEQATGVRLMGNGAAYTGVADSFLEYGLLCPLFWFVLSFLVAIVYTQAVRSWSPWWMFCYVGFLCSSHWLVSQAFSAAFVPGMYFQLVPLSVFCLVWLLRQLTAPPRKIGPRRTRAIPPLAHTAPLPS